MATNRVLDLDGTNSFVELPPNMFNDLDEATIETWAKVEVFTAGFATRFFNYGGERADLCLGVDGMAWFVLVDPKDPRFPKALRMIHSPFELNAGRWYHLAGVCGQDGMRLYLDGVLVGTNEYKGSFSSLPNGDRCLLGNYVDATQAPQTFKGQIDEVRVWKVARTAEQIRETMFKRLTGSEPDLVGLWNFDDGTAHDSSPGAHHGKMIGRATVAKSDWPAALLLGKVTDPAGTALAGAQIEVRQGGRMISSAATDGAGYYALMVPDRCDLFVTTGKLSAYRLGFQPGEEGRRQLDWILAETESERFGIPASAGGATAIPQRVGTANAQPAKAKAGTPNASRFPAGTVVARSLTDENGSFDFANVQPGAYQLRAQVLGGKAWFQAGEILYARGDISDAERTGLRSIEWELAPFKKGHWTTYNTSHGLPSNEILKLWYDAEDGSLWITTAGGVSRFDGKEFTNLTAEDGLLDDFVSDLWREPSGIWWFCTDRGVSRYDPAAAKVGRKAFRNYSAQDGLGGVKAVAQTPDGRMWFGSWEGAISRLDGEKVSRFTSRDAFGLSSMLATPDGLLWLGSRPGLIRFDGTNFVNVTPLGARTDASSPAVAPDGSFWLGVNVAGGGNQGAALVRYDSKVKKGAQPSLQSFTQKDGLMGSAGSVGCVQSADGNLWIANGVGVSRFDGANFVNFTMADGLAGNGVTAIISTPDGAVWCGTANNGLSRYDPDSFAHFDVADGLISPNSPVWGYSVAEGAGLAAPDGTLWFASGGGDVRRKGLVRFDGRGFEQVLPQVDNEVCSLVRGKDDSIWVGIRGVRIARYSGGLFFKLTKSHGLVADDAASLAMGTNGELWIGTMWNGLSRYDGQKFQNFTKELGVPETLVWSLAVDAKNKVWIGTWREGGLVSYDGQRFERFTITNGLPSNNIRSLLSTSEGVVWIGTDRGLSRLADGKFTNYRKSKDRLLNNMVTGLTQDADGVLWIGTPSSVTRYDGNVWSTLTSLDGIEANTIWNTLPDRDGNFWFSTEKGLTRYRPDHRLSPRRPQLTIRADEEYTEHDGVARITTGRKALFRLNVVDLKTRPETRRFRWQFAEGAKPIDGGRHAPGWLAGTSETQFDWQTNRAGTYTFAVQYIDRDLNYSQPTVLTLKVSPVWYANAWITVPGGAAALGLIGWTFVARSLVIRRKREAEQLREQLLREEQTARQTLEQQVAETRKAEASMRESQELYHSLVENIPHIVVRKDLNGVYTFLNSMTEDWLGLRVLGVNQVGKTDFDLFPAPLAEQIREADRKVMETGEILEGEHTLVRDAGNAGPGTRYYHWVRVPLRDAAGKINGVQVICWDVTEAKAAEEELRRAKQAADVASAAKSQFLASMSHELRTPLTAIIGFSELLHAGAEADGRQEDAEDITRINDSATHLLGLINGILDLSKVEAGKMTLYLEPFDIGQMIAEVVATIQPLASKNGNRLEVDCPKDIGAMRADLTKVRQTLFNLLSNANKFTNHGTIRLEVKRVMRSALNPQLSTLNFLVSDTGIGITPEQVSKLFEAFSQADASTSKKYGGTGLGLVISRKFCQLMGGDLSVESVLGQGSTFTVTLPAEVQEPKASPGAGATHEGARAVAGDGPTLLVIDDEPAVRALMERTLSKEGYRVLTAESGARGLELARQWKPAVITLDVMMAGMDGWAVLSSLKADPELMDIPVVMMTIVDDQKLGFTLGASEYLTKPIDWKRLTAVLQKYGEQSGTRRVLVVEDDASVRELLQRNLEKEGWSVALAENGRVALDRIAEATPALILLDLMMPEMDGFEFMEALRQRECGRGIPVVVITARQLTEEDRRRLNGRVVRILQKSQISTEELLSEVRRLLAEMAQGAGPVACGSDTPIGQLPSKDGGG